MFPRDVRIETYDPELAKPSPPKPSARKTMSS